MNRLMCDNIFMKKTILSCMPLVPTVMHWLLPVGIENKMYVIIVETIPFFIFNLCFLAYIYNYRKLVRKGCTTIPNGAKKATVMFAFFYLVYSLLHGFAIGIDGLLVQMLNNQALIFSLLLFMLYPMDRDMIERTKYIVIPTTFLLCSEVVLYSLGILQYSIDLGTHESAGVLRISTTVGAATGTAVVLVMLGVMLLYYTDIKLKIRFALVVFVTIAIFLLQSRGSVGVWGLFLLYYIYQNYLRRTSFKLKIRILLIGVLSIGVLYRIGVFEPIIERQKNLVENNMWGSGRDELENKAFHVFGESSGFGIGLGQTNYEKSLGILNVKRSNPIGVHNHYICVLTELGVIGLVIFLIYLINIFKYLNFRNTTSIYILLMLLLTFTTEPVFLLAEFAYPFSFLLMISMEKH